ncbi:MAG: hypothetical protein BEN19_05100 [Epulopiscium sp. Nuni2H_MBin003]|nr:MAG: hypothetical protein BEN19_05100 [Epulopiscium sp. Nuni2H_MBin003]
MNINVPSQYAISGNFGKINQEKVNTAGLNSDEGSIKLEEGSTLSVASSLSISSQGKAMSMIDSLNKQKSELLDNKNELIASTLANGDDLSSIEDQLDMYEEKLLLIEEQIATKRQEQQEEKMAEREEKLKAYAKPQATNEDSMSNRLMSISSMATTLDQAKANFATKKDMENQASILETQAKNSSGSAKTQKLEEASKLTSQASNITSDITQTLSSTNETIKQDNETTNQDNETTNQDNESNTETINQ